MHNRTYKNSIFRLVPAYVLTAVGFFMFLGGFLGYGRTTSVQHTTIHLNIISHFTGEIRDTSTNTLFLDNTYRTTEQLHYITISSRTKSTYTITGDLIEHIADTINNPLLANTHLITLLTGEGEKNLAAIFIELDTTGDNEFVSQPLRYFIDTTPPAMTTWYQGPEYPSYVDDPMSFSWAPVTDSGVGLDHYIVQLSRSLLFTTAMEFTTQDTELILGGDSLTSGKRYRRRGAIDKLGNVLYSYPSNFFARVKGGSASSIIKQGPGLTNDTPISDQCPDGDTSLDYFDGLCTPTLHTPELVNIPKKDQTTNILSWRERMFLRLTEPKTTLYIFPNYEPPKPFTIYEYAPTYVYKDIYEAFDTPEHTSAPGSAYEQAKQSAQTTYPQLPYRPSLGVQKPGVAPVGIDAHLITPASQAQTFIMPHPRTINYLYYWFITIRDSCAQAGQFCPIDPVCPDITSNCYIEFLRCPDMLHVDAYEEAINRQL